ncbi:hypothetical protein [Staphylococcus debuckii]|uniref:hypothetical protein n=1 Tax=Staphylococcus debuckii TaxID=2044912 RepID=UPI001F0C5D8E|nr:hypothetical protein [Staphylococcus debuckii]
MIFLDQNEASEFMIDLRDINMSWDQLITDEDELVEAGYPQSLINHWIENGMIASFSPNNGGIKHFYTQDVFKATAVQLKLQSEAEHDMETTD